MKKGLEYALIVLGAALFVLAWWLFRSWDGAEGIFRVLPGLMLGIGCGALGYGIGTLVNRKVLESSPEARKELEISLKDERNIMISNRAKGKAYDMALYIYSALMLAFVVIGAEITEILLLILAYLAVNAVFIFYMVKYQKEM